MNAVRLDDAPTDKMTFGDAAVYEAGGQKKQHPCAECGKSFNCRSRLNLHLKIHTGEKPHGCAACGKRFSDKSTLRKHMVTHTGEKAFRCLVCHKCFRLKHHLQAHMRTHMRMPARAEAGTANTDADLSEHALASNLKTVLFKMNFGPSNFD